MLSLASLLIAGFSSLAQIKSFDDIRGIDSEEAFIRVCLENGHKKDKYQVEKMLSYEYLKDQARYETKDTVTVSHYKEQTFQGKTYPARTLEIEYKKGQWVFMENDLNTKRKNGKCYYDKILTEVKSECTLIKIEEEALLYECPEEGYFTDGVKFKGRLSFYVSSFEGIDDGYIAHEFPD